MVPSRTVELIVGAFVALGFLGLFFLAMQVSNLSALQGENGYELSARFDNVGGLKVRSPVTVAGVRIGRVSSIEFDNTTYEAVVRMSIGSSYNRLPKDTAASIYTAGLLGEQYIGLEPGGEEKVLQGGDEIRFTQPAIVLEQLIGQFLFNKAAEGPSQP
jgi:phospholipid/cholesterol/gamma-HCH transport system substrate-binding protein